MNVSVNYFHWLFSYLKFDGYDDCVKIGVTEELKKLTKNSFSVTVSLKPDTQHQVENIPYDNILFFLYLAIIVVYLIQVIEDIKQIYLILILNHKQSLQI